MQARISQPRSKVLKVYWAQVEGKVDESQLRELQTSVSLKDGPARALSARPIAAPEPLWPRVPPIRFRASVPDTWLEIRLEEGRNRQVRRMTAAIGLPTLRLIRSAIGPFQLTGLGPGETRLISNTDAWAALNASGRKK
jgi:23S rRNA pseudouridine2457 synthase